MTTQSYIRSFSGWSLAPNLHGRTFSQRVLLCANIGPVLHTLNSRMVYYIVGVMMHCLQSRHSDWLLLLLFGIRSFTSFTAVIPVAIWVLTEQSLVFCEGFGGLGWRLMSCSGVNTVTGVRDAIIVQVQAGLLFTKSQWVPPGNRSWQQMCPSSLWLFY